MAKRIIAIFILMVLLFPFNTFAQVEPPLAAVSVDLWPEFDRPTTLVIYHITLSSQVSLPYQMSVRIPAAAGAPHAVAVQQPGGALISVPFEQEPEVGWTRVIFQATAPEIQLEYYDPGLEIDGNRRSFQYTWPGDYAVDAFSVEIQRPIGASEVQIKPGMVSSRQGTDGLTYYQMNVGPLSKSQTFEISVEYLKETAELSFSNLTVAPSAALDGPNSGKASMTSFLPWILGFLGLALIIGGAVWYWQSGRQKVETKKEPRNRRSSKAQAFSEDGQEGKIYCHQCGKRASPGDRFCRACGTQLRIS